MKILLINQAFYPDGVATAQHAIDLAHYLTENGHQVSVISGNRGYENRDVRFKNRETYRGIEIFRVGSTGFGKLSLLRRVVDSVTFDFLLLVRLFTIPKQDLVLCLTSPPLVGVFGMIYRIFRRGEFVQWLMDINPEAAIAVGYLRKGSLTSRLLLSLFRWTLKKSDRIVVLDRWMKQTVMAHDVTPDRIVIIPPWPVQETKGQDPEPLGNRDNIFRKERGWEDKFIVLYSGNHSIVHPLDTLLGAANLLKEDKDILFVFVGSGLRVEEVTRFAKNHQLTNIVQLAFQPIEKLKATLAMANLHAVVLGDAVSGLVHTSKVYGVMASGRPFVAICPRQSHLYDLLQECPYGFQVEHGESEKLAESIREAKRLGNSVLRDYAQKNLDYSSKNLRRDKLLCRFLNEVIEPGKAKLSKGSKSEAALVATSASKS